MPKLMNILIQSILLITVLTTYSYAISNEELVSRFKGLAKMASSIVDQAPPEISASEETSGMNPETKALLRKWYRRKVYINNVQFDVKKTESLVSPYAGELVFDYHTKGAEGDYLDQVKSGPDNFDTYGTPCKTHYAFQSEKWVRKSTECINYNGLWEAVNPRQGSIYTCSILLPQE